MLAYFDCFHGAAGDMLLAALLDAGVALPDIEAVLAGLPLTGYHIVHTRTTRQHITGSTVQVVQDTPQPPRDWATIRALLADSTLPPPVAQQATAVFARLAAAEAAVHGVAVDDVHFHEVGALDSIVDSVAVCAALHLLGVQQVYCSPLPTGRGWVATQHGMLPVPAPATLRLLADAPVPTVPAPPDSDGELLTPTAAALLTATAQFTQPPMQVARVGYGFGQKHFARLNGLRVWLGTAAHAAPAHAHEHPPAHAHEHPHAHAHAHEHPPAHAHAHTHTHEHAQHGTAPVDEPVVELRCNLDDVTGEVAAYAIERLLAAGAYDAWATPLVMKKGRPAVQLACLAAPGAAAALSALLLRETPTLGVRRVLMHRHAAGRQRVAVATPWGTVHVKQKLLDGAVVGNAPEYDECAALARAHGVPLAQVYAAALAAVSPPPI